MSGARSYIFRGYFESEGRIYRTWDAWIKMVFHFVSTFSLHWVKKRKISQPIKLNPKTNHCYTLIWESHSACWQGHFAHLLSGQSIQNWFEKESILSAHRVSNVNRIEQSIYLLLILCLHHGCVDINTTQQKQTLTTVYKTVEHFITMWTECIAFYRSH